MELNFTLSEPMPVRWRSRCSICARYCLLLRLRSRSSSSSASTPAAMTPPSLREIGGSATMVCSMRCAQIAEFVDGAVQRLQALRCRNRASAARTAGILRQRSGQRQHVARVGRFQRDAAQQAFQIEDAVERAPQFFAADQVL